MAENEHFLRTENRTVDGMIRDFPPNCKSHVKNKQLLCQRGILHCGWAVWSGEEDPGERPTPPPPPCSDMATASCTKPRFTAAQDTSIVTIKAKYRDDFIKFQLPVSSGMLEFQQQVAKRLNLQGGTYRVKYQDEENDWILIVCDDDLQNCICNSISQGRNTVRMWIQPITNCPS
ncbi:unnamed protein product [Camellia sinensis]